MSMLTLHFSGMCCFLDGRETDSFAKRVVLPRDMQFAKYKDDPRVYFVAGHPVLRDAMPQLMKGLGVEAPGKAVMKFEQFQREQQ